MKVNDLPADVLANLGNPHWRLRNLYTIVDRDANVIPFRPNAAQEAFLGNLHTRNVILKARQRGFSTLIQLAALDQALFNDNFTAGIIADNLDNAGKFLKRIIFAYNKLPQAIRDAVRVKSINSSLIEFHNGSSINVDTSFRSGSLQFLHVSEYGKICIKYPDKAKEIRTGTLPALAPNGMAFYESTAEGHEGDFFEMCKEAEDKARLGQQLTKIDFKFHFYSWWDEDQYQLDPSLVQFTQDERLYIHEIESKIGRQLEPSRWAWYWVTRRRLGDEMFQEYPSTPEEAFHHSVEGRYYAQQFIKVRNERRISTFPHMPDRPVYSFWDIGQGDETAVWCMQFVNQRFRWIKYMEASGEPFSYFIQELQKLGYTWATHWLPHDADHKRQLGLINMSAREMLEELAPGWQFDTVERIPDVTVGIQQARQLLALSEFDDAGCSAGIARLEAYRKEWNERTGSWKSTPFHGPESNGADAYRQCAQLWAAGELQIPAPTRTIARRGTQVRTWRTA